MVQSLIAPANLPRVILHRRKVDAVKRFHPWIFSGAIRNIEIPPHSTEPQEGDLVLVTTEGAEILATGFWGTGSIAVKVLEFGAIPNINQCIAQKIAKAFAVRQTLGLTAQTEGAPVTNCYRLVNSEGDGLPGLIIDWYNGTAVIQSHGMGLYQHREAIVAGLQQVYGTALQAVYDKSAATMNRKSTHKSAFADGYLWGQPENSIVTEYGRKFTIDWEVGQKTGFFVDQREHRQLFAQYARHKKVLNTFCYSGGFSVYAMTEGAQLVHSVDSSAKAIEWTNQNIALNPTAHQGQIHESYVADVFNFLKNTDTEYNAIVLDPPAFAKNLTARHQAVQAYKRLNLASLEKIASGGVIFTFSCSQVVTPEHFTGAVTAAAIESGKTIRILHHLTQPPDHATSIYHPEGLYLKGLVLLVE
ncbi:MAG: class I SAM-dependent rRNA methyltransferase [Pseudanabaena sp. ELA607]